MRKDKVKCIAIFSAYMPPHVGGIERYVDNLSRQLVGMGYRPIIVTSNYNDEETSEIVNGIVIIRLPIYGVFKNRYPIVKINGEEKALIKKLNDYDIEAIIVNTRFHLTSLVGVRYAKRRNIPVYLIEHGSNYVTLNNRFIDFFANRYEDVLAFYLRNKVDGFYGVSDACGKWLEHFGIMAKGTWYNSIDVSQGGPERVKHNGINFLYAGRIIKQKGVYNILVGFSKLASKYKDIHLYIAGDGPELDSYKGEFKGNRISFLGRLTYDELLEYYAKCDIFLYPPIYPEGLPTSILEAGMMGCAVIGTDQGGIKEIIMDNENGLIVSGDVNDLELAMERLILDSELRERLALELCDTVKSKFSWDVTTLKILKSIGLEGKENLGDKRKVLHILSSNSYSGAENVACTIIDNCSDNYDMYYCSPNGPIKEVLEKRNIKFIPLKRLSILELRRIVKRYNIDIIHAHDYKASAISVFLNRKIISHIHCDYNLLSCRAVVGFVYSVIQKKFDRVIVVSNEILENASFKKKIADKTRVINNVVDKREVIDKVKEFETKKYDLIFVGRLIPLKQPLLFIDIVNELAKKIPNIRACIIGDGELYEDCRQQIVGYKLEDNIDMLGFKSNPFPYIKNSKVAVMPSSYEGLGLVVIEAMILGTIVVNSGVGGLKSIFKNHSKYICHSKNEYVACIEKLLREDKNTYKADCDNMIKNFTDTREYKKKIIEIYEGVLK